MNELGRAVPGSVNGERAGRKPEAGTQDWRNRPDRPSIELSLPRTWKDLYARMEAYAASQLAERDRLLKSVGQALGDAARETNCAGPVAHRIRVLRRELAERIEGLERLLRHAFNHNRGKLPRGRCPECDAVYAELTRAEVEGPGRCV